MSPITTALTAALLHSLWLGAIVVLTLTFLLSRMRDRTPNARYAVSLGGLTVLAVTPLVAVWVLYGPLDVPAANAMSGSVAVSGLDPISAGLSAASRLPLLEWVLPAWLLGVGLFSLRLVWACTRIGRLHRRGIEASREIMGRARRLAGRMGLELCFRVVETSDGGPGANGPGVVGWLRPVVFLPSSTLLGLSPDQLEAILAHELAHIRRNDYLVNLAQMVVETVMFFNPAVWWISARIREERELCCDDLAIQVAGDPVVYARALTRLERARLQVSPGVPAGGRMVGDRIRRILGQPSSSRGSSLAPALIALAIAVTGGFLTTFGLEASVQEPIPVERSIPVPASTPIAPIPVETGAPVPASAPLAPVPVERSAAVQMPDAWAVYVTRDQGRMSIVTPGTGVPTADDLGGGDVLWFRRGGEAWVVRDAGVVNEVALIAANNRGFTPPADPESRAAQAEAIRVEAGQASPQKLGEAGGNQIERIFEDAIASGLAEPAP